MHRPEWPIGTKLKCNDFTSASGKQLFNYAQKFGNCFTVAGFRRIGSGEWLVILEENVSNPLASRFEPLHRFIDFEYEDIMKAQEAFQSIESR